MDITLNAKERDTSVKGVQLRKQGLIPACIFSKDMESFPVQINAVEFNNCVKKGAVKIQLKVGKKVYLASIDEIQKNCVGTVYHHVSFHAFNANEKVSMHVPVHLTGKAIGQTSGGVLTQQLSEVTLYGAAKDLPDELVVDVKDLELGHSLHISDLPENSLFEIKDSKDKVIVACNYSRLQLEDQETASTDQELEPILVSEDKAKEAA